MLKDSIAVLAQTEPPRLKGRMRVLADINAQVSALETELGLPHTLPTLNVRRADARLAQLEAKMSQKAGPAAAPVATITAPPAPAAPVVPPAIAAPAAGMLSATLAEFQRMDAATRKQFADDGGALALADFESLTSKSRMAFMTGGGKIAEGVQSAKVSTAASPSGGASGKSRSEFEVMSPKARMNYVLSGGSVTD